MNLFLEGPLTYPSLGFTVLMVPIYLGIKIYWKWLWPTILLPAVDCLGFRVTFVGKKGDGKPDAPQLPAFGLGSRLAAQTDN